jgi:hypothetical protein
MIPLDASGGIIPRLTTMTDLPTTQSHTAPDQTYCERPPLESPLAPHPPQLNNPPHRPLAYKLVLQGSILDTTSHPVTGMTSFKFPLPLFTQERPLTPPTHGHTIRVVGIPRSNSVSRSNATPLPLLMDGGTNICITNDIANLINAKPIVLFPLLVSMTGPPPSHDEFCTMEGLLALPVSSGNTFYQLCFYCKNATETIISPNAILASNAHLDTWVQIGHKGDKPGSIHFSGPLALDTFTFSLMKRDGLYYCPMDLFIAPLLMEAGSTAIAQLMWLSG